MILISVQLLLRVYSFVFSINNVSAYRCLLCLTFHRIYLTDGTFQQPIRRRITTSSIITQIPSIKAIPIQEFSPE